LPQHRFATAGDMCRALDEFLIEAGADVAPSDIAGLLLQANDLTPLESQAVVKTRAAPPTPAPSADDQPITLPDDNFSTRPHLKRLESDVPPTRPAPLLAATPIGSGVLPRGQEETV